MGKVAFVLGDIRREPCMRLPIRRKRFRLYTFRGYLHHGARWTLMMASRMLRDARYCSSLEASFDDPLRLVFSRTGAPSELYLHTVCFTVAL